MEEGQGWEWEQEWEQARPSIEKAEEIYAEKQENTGTPEERQDSLAFAQGSLACDSSRW